jgi:ABC-type multidrug transport system ATPase subunit
MLELSSLSKRFRSGAYGVQDFSLKVAGGVLGLLGPNGAGKTTLMQMIATVTTPTTGGIRFQDRDVVAEPEWLRQRLGYLPQDFGVYDNLTAADVLTYFGALKGVSSRNRVGELLEMVNLHTVASRQIGTFSGGMRQRLGIAQALINDPDLVIVDEPTAGLDPEERLRFRNLLADIGTGKLVILSTHIVSDVESIASQIAVMRQGRLVVCAPPEELLKSARGAVWDLVLSSAEFEARRGGLKISNAVRQSDGVHLRIVQAESPGPGAVAAEPDLEDAFVYTMSRPAA